MEHINKYQATKGNELVLQFKVKLPSENAEKPGLVILMHGVGSNEEHMFQLADEFDGNVVVVSARAPFTISPGRYAWFAVDTSSGIRRIDEEQAEKSRQVINLFVNQLTERYLVDKDKIYLGGFSQGGIMAYNVGLTYPQKFAGIFAFSSRLLPEIKPLIKETTALEHLKVFIAHGIHDQTLTIDYAREARAYLNPLLTKLEYHEYEMSHTIIDQELEAFRIWLGIL